MVQFVDIAGEVDRYRCMNKHLQSVMRDLKYEADKLSARIRALRDHRARLEAIIEEHGTDDQKALLAEERKVWARGEV